MARGIKTRYHAADIARKLLAVPDDPHTVGLGHQCSMSEVCHELECQGCVLIGQGAYSKVYALPGDDIVLKLFHHSNDRWIHYAQWITNNSPNIHTPQLINRPAAVTDEFWAVHMERLQPLQNYLIYLQYVSPALRHIKHININSIFDAANYDWLQQNHADLAELYHYLHVISQGCLDLGPDNVMRRGNTLVLLDPV